MGDKDFKEPLPDLSLIPDDRAEEETTTDLPEEQEIDIKAIMAEYEEMMADGVETPIEDREQHLPAEDEPQGSESDEQQAMREMIATMRALTEEVKQLRAQIETKPNEMSLYWRERLPALVTVSEYVDAPESKTELAIISEHGGAPETKTEFAIISEHDGAPETKTEFAIISEHAGAPETKPEAQSEQKQSEAQDELKKPEKKNKVLSIISSVLFYVVIVAMVLGAFLMRSTSKGEPFMIAGFSAANVLTSSMEDVYPRGSLIITKQVDAKELQIGDDITFMVSEDSSITHRIIGITENYQGTGARAFQTQGTKNPNPDKEMVAAANVVGKVIFHNKALGDFANFVKENWPILIFILVVIIGLITFLKWNAKKSDEDDEEMKDEPKEKKTRLHIKKRNEHSERRNKNNGDE